jgi:basic membrane protein A
MTDLIGRTLGPYQILSEIGHGGMANVYRAAQPSIGREVAIKVLPAHFLQDRSFLDRFDREVQVIARLQHPHILPVYDFGEQDGLPYIVMAYLTGGSLADHIRRYGAGMPLEEIARLVAQAAAALDFAHSKGIIHRDLKPSNILLDEQGNAYLSDFGIAKVTEATAQLTGSGIIGTPAYMAPEMSEPDGMSPLIDIYALGVTLYEMLTGDQPYHAPTPMGVLLAHASKPVPDAREKRPELPDAVQAVVEGAMAKDPRQRYQMASDLASGLGEAIRGGQAAAPATLIEPVAEPEYAPSPAASAPPTPPPSAGPEADYSAPQAAPAAPAASPQRSSQKRGFPIWLLGALGLVGVVIVAGLALAFWPRDGAPPAEPDVATPPASESTPEEPPAEAPAAEEPVVEEPALAAPPAEPFRAGMVTDVGGIDDASFNASSWEGLRRAGDELGIEAQYLESQQQTDYATNITQFLDQDYNIIVTVGFLLGEDTETFAQANPETDFAIVDYSYETTYNNLLGLTFATDQAAFLAGYTAAAMTQTGRVGTFGGIEIPPVTIFMVGFENGVNAYNEQHGTNVEVLGMDLFVGNFESTDDGRRAGEDLIAEGADIIMPVAGPVGLGTAAAVQEHPGTKLIGVDTDWCVSAADFCPVVLTSVMKRVDVAVHDAVVAAYNGTFEGGVYVGTLENGGVGLAPFHEFEDELPDGLLSELADIKAALINGTISTGS